jgi:hypothetical protein
MQVGLEASLAREQIGQVPGGTVGMSGSVVGLVDGVGVGVAAGAEAGTGTDGDVCVVAAPTSRSSCSLSVSESTWSVSGGSLSRLDAAVV